MPLKRRLYFMMALPCWGFPPLERRLFCIGTVCDLRAPTPHHLYSACWARTRLSLQMGVCVVHACIFAGAGWRFARWHSRRSRIAEARAFAATSN